MPSPTSADLAVFGSAIAPVNASFLSPNIMFNRMLLRRPQSGVARSSLTCPVSPDSTPTADTLFDDADPKITKRYYLPHWQIAQQQIGSKVNVRVSLSQEPGKSGSVLAVYLAPITDAALDPRLSNAGLSPFPGAVPKVQLQYSTAKFPSVPPQTFTVSAASDIPNGLRLTLELNSSATDDVFAAMTTPTLVCELVITYIVQVAILAPTIVVAQNANSSAVAPIAVRPLMASVAVPASAVAAAPAPIRAAAPMAMMMRPNMMMRSPLIGPNVFPPREIDPPPQNPPAAGGASPPSEPLYNQLTESFGSILAFSFLEATHPYIYSGITADPSNGGSSYNTYDLSYQESRFTYYQSTALPAVFFFLPDAFKICRRPHQPFYPAMSITTSGTSAEDLQVTLTYFAVPIVDAQRVVAAKNQLRDNGVTEDGQLLPTADTQLQLALPNKDGGEGPYQNRNVKPDFAHGFTDAITLPVDQFTQLFDSFFSDTAIYFQGNVTARVGKSISPVIPFKARANDLAAFELFGRSKSIDTASGGLSVTFTNATESTIHVPENLPVRLIAADGSVVPSTLVSPIAECDLEPLLVDAGDNSKAPGSFTVVMKPSSGIADAGMDIALDMGALALSCEREALWAAIVDQTTIGVLRSKVSVKAPAGKFQPTTDGHYLAALEVEFEGGKGATLSPSPGMAILSAEVVLPLSITDYILRKISSPSYRYKRTIIYFDGTQLADKDWLTSSSSDLWPMLDPASFNATPNPTPGT